MRLLVHVEGETEETFINEVLGPHLLSKGYSKVSARLIGNARQRSQRGGIKAWQTVRKEIMNHLRADRQSVATTMIDYYGLPQRGSGAWPSRATAGALPFPRNAEAVEAALSVDIAAHMGRGFNPSRFVPHVVLHEFEALLFSDCTGFARGMERPDLGPRLQAIRDGFSCPEEIDDSPVTAPSKRVTALIPEYQKPLMGTLAALEIGLATMRIPVKKATHSGNKKPPGGWSNPDTATISGWLF